MGNKRVFTLAGFGLFFICFLFDSRVIHQDSGGYWDGSAVVPSAPQIPVATLSILP